jgi:hypothetical protein
MCNVTWRSVFVCTPVWEQQNVRVYPFKQLGRVRQDFVTFLKPYCIIPDPMHLSNSSTLKKTWVWSPDLSFQVQDTGKCRTRSPRTSCGILWESVVLYTSVTRLFHDEYGHKLLYTVNPSKVCCVMKSSHILGPTTIFRNPGIPRF